MRTMLLGVALALVGCTAPTASEATTETLAEAVVTESPFRAFAKDMNEAYGEAGRDNNYVASRQFDSAAYAALTATKQVRPLATAADTVEALRFCEFITTGAYGEHFSKSKAWGLAREWATKLTAHPSFAGAERIEGKNVYEAEIISSECAIAVHDTAGNVVVMQGFGVD